MCVCMCIRVCAGGGGVGVGGWVDNEKLSWPLTMCLTYQTTALQYKGLDCQQKHTRRYLSVAVCVCVEAT